MMKKLILTGLAFAGLAAPAQAANLVTNGTFETGSLASWSVVNSGSPILAAGICPSAGRSWNVSTGGAATGCSAAGNPGANPAGGGTYAAYVMNDGPGNTTYNLIQSIALPTGITAATLSFDFSSVSGYSGGIRTLQALLVDPTSQAVLANLYTYTVPFSDGNAAWANVSVNALAASAFGGTTVNLVFRNFSPDTWTGPAGLGLDNVSLDVTARSAVPEPATWMMMILGFGLIGATMRQRKTVSALA